MHVEILNFEELTVLQLYQVLKARMTVFVVEQNCVYQDIDGLDEQCQHILLIDDVGQLIAYCRIIPPQLNQNDQSNQSQHMKSSMVGIGRFLVLPNYRKQGLARHLANSAIDYCQLNHPKKIIKISAQSYLKAFYLSLGFSVEGDEYLEDGIPHIEMRM